MSYFKTTQYFRDYVCGFDLEFRRMCSDPNQLDYKKVDPNKVEQLTEYNASIENLITSYEDMDGENPVFSLSEKVFPVVFHPIIESPDVLTPSGQLDFNVQYILNWINHWFSGTNISFRAADIDPDGNVMELPGFNPLNASSIRQTRNMTHRGVTRTVDFNCADHGVAFYEYITYDHREGSAATQSQEGVLFEYIQDNYSWNPTQYINIFLLNRTNSIPSRIVMTSANPYLTEINGNVNRLSIGVDLWAIGRSYDSSIPLTLEVGNSIEQTNFGYSYANTTSEGQLANTSSVNEGFRARATTIAHSLAHTLGLLHPKFKFVNRDLGNDCSEYPFLLDIIRERNTPTLQSWQGIYEDSDINTKGVRNYIKMLDYDEALDVDDCSDDLVLTVSSNMMNHTQFTGGEGVENSVIPTFTEQQIFRMHANCEYLLPTPPTETEQELTFSYGILGEILYNSANVFITKPDSNFGCPEDDTDPRMTPSYAFPVNSTTVSRSELDQYSDAKNAIVNIIRQLN